MTSTNSSISRFNPTRLLANGYAIVPQVIPELALERLRFSAEALAAAVDVDTRKGTVGGLRNLLSISADVRLLAESPELRRLAAPVLGEQCFAVRAILFDKTPGANWKVPWHQDLTIAVRRDARDARLRSLDGQGRRPSCAAANLSP